MDHLKVALAQIDLAVGDVAGNTAKIIDYASARTRSRCAPTWWFSRNSAFAGIRQKTCCFMRVCAMASRRRLPKFAAEVSGIAVRHRLSRSTTTATSTTAAPSSRTVMFSRTIASTCLPNYSVFDEERYFTAGKKAAVFKFNGIRIGLTICEDVWRPGPDRRPARSAGAECVVVINGSPYEIGARQKRRERRATARRGGRCSGCLCQSWWVARMSWCSMAVRLPWTRTARSAFVRRLFEEGLHTARCCDGYGDGRRAAAPPRCIEPLATGWRAIYQARWSPARATT